MSYAHIYTCMHTHLHTYTCTHAYHTHMHTCIYIYTHTHAHICICVLTNTQSRIQITYIQVHAHTHVHMHTSAHIGTHVFLNICLSYHSCTPFVFPFTHSLCTALLPCLRDALDGYRQFSRHHGSLFMRSSAILMAGLGGPPSLQPTLFMGPCPCPQAQVVELSYHLFFHLSVNVTCSVLTRSIENYKTGNTPYQPCDCKPWGMLGQ